ncbi:MAG: potassium transporter, partial [Muribaculaceae bacterium]|nr:potassium transporter [Muribaculaceae bacterium]
QMMLRDMVYSRRLNSMLPTLLYVRSFTLCVEAIGAVVIYATVPPELGLTVNDRIVFSAFLSLSAFCNAGFTNIPDGMANGALMNGTQSIYLAVSAIVIAGAIGFPILVNFKDVIVLKVTSLFRRRRSVPVHIYDLNTKLVLATTSVIFFIGAGAFLVLEYDNTLRGMPLWHKCVQSVFNAVTPRSAGFASVNPASFLPATLLLVMLQMWIGGASQSMAGGIKVNTLAVVLLSLRSVIHGHSGVTSGHRTIAYAGVRRAHAVVGLSILAYFIYSFTLLLLEPQLPVRAVLFETLSALFTVGSSLGITDSLGDPAKIVLSSAMLVGRVGILSLLMGLVRTRRDSSSLFPSENVIIN